MLPIDPSVFAPTTVALIGASDEPGSVGNTIRSNLSSFTGRVYPVNPKHKTVGGLPAFAAVRDAPEHIDLAVIAVPAQFVPGILREAAAAHVPAAIVISAGFRETGPEGAAREREITELANASGMTVVGPNCLGVMNTEIGLNATFASGLPERGGLAFVSQSGALGTSVLDYAKEQGIGFSKFISLGNKAAVDEIAALAYLKDDPATRAIMLYVEDIGNAHAFIRTARALADAEVPKPVILLKAGTTAEGARASASHTGALGGPDAYYDALARQARVIRVPTVSDMLTTAITLLHNPLPHGNAVGILTNAGGPGILMTDEAVRSGLVLPVLSEATQKSLSSGLPPFASVKNPVDVLGDAKADRYEHALAVMAGDPLIDTMLVLLTPQSGTEVDKTAEAIVRAKGNKPVAVSFMGGSLVASGERYLRTHGVAVTEYPEEAARAMGKISLFSRLRAVPNDPFAGFAADAARARAILGSLPRESVNIPEREAGMILDAYGFPMLKTIRASSAEEALAAATSIGKPCAFKVLSPDITHKRDVGGVTLNVTPDTAVSAYDSLVAAVSMAKPEARIDGVLVVEMAPLGLECILGAIRKPGFGTLVMVGIGGTYVEITKDIAFGVAPVGKTDAREMLEALHAHKLFSGFRGSAPLDTDVLVEAIGRLSQLVLEHEELMEVDINPFTLYPAGQGAKVVDVRMVRKA